MSKKVVFLPLDSYGHVNAQGKIFDLLNHFLI